MLLKDKRFSLIFLAILGLIGSFITFYSTNLLMHDLANNFFGLQDAGIIISGASFVFVLDFVLLTLFVIRIYRRPEYKKALIKLYSLLLLIFSSLGLVLSILTGTIMYGSFLAPYPFAGYSIICLIFNLLLVGLAIYIRFFLVKKIKDDESKRTMKASYVWYSILLSFMVFWMYNRFGAFLWSPVWIQLRTLYLTWPFFVYILLPILWYSIVVIRIFSKSKATINATLVLSITSLVLNIGILLAIVLISREHTEFVSAISPALGLERLASAPVDTIIHAISGIGLSVYETIYAIKLFKRNK